MKEVFEYFSQYPLDLNSYGEFTKKVFMAIFENNFEVYRNTIIEFPDQYLNIIARIINSLSDKEKKFMYNVLLNFNMNFISTTPYSCFAIGGIKFIGVGMTNEGKLEDKLLNKKEIKKYILDILNTRDELLNQTDFALKKKILMQEKMRVFWQEEYRKIKEWYNNINEENIDKIIESLRRQQLTDEEAIHFYKEILDEVLHCEKNKAVYVKPKKEKVVYDFSGLNIQVKNTKIGFSNKEIKEMERDVRNILDTKKIVDVDTYLDCIKKGNILVNEGRITKEMLEDLYKRLIVNQNSYKFLYQKAMFLMNTNLEIDLYPIIEEINILNEMVNDCQENEKDDLEYMLLENYQKLYNLLDQSYTYERTLNLV